MMTQQRSGAGPQLAAKGAILPAFVVAFEIVIDSEAACKKGT